jgi:phosphate transport system substrate-binding protein
MRAPLWVGLLALIAAVAVVLIERGEVPPFVHTPTARTSNVLPQGPDLHLAGSGSNLVLTRALAAAFRVQHPEARLVVHDSIGSTGAVRAVADGAIRIGLIARPLREDERALNLDVTPYARVPIIFLAHPDVRDRDITRPELVQSLRGERNAWRDGTPLVWLLRERGDAGTEIAAHHIEGLLQAHEEALATHRFRVLFHDDDMARGILGVRGALGISDLPAARAHTPTAPILTLDGVAATCENVRLGRYPLFKDLAFVTRGEVDATSRAFLVFASSPEGRAIIEAGGGIALDTAPSEAP